MKHFIMPCPNHGDASLEGFLMTGELTYGQEIMRPAVVICPGGGYIYCSEREADPVALAYANAGFHAFVLRYSVGWEAAGFAPLEELSWAIGLLRENSEEWNIAPDQIAVCGFSAGGHLAMASGVMGQNRPNAMILGYPVASLPNIPGMDYMLKLLTGKKAVTDEDAAQFELISKVTENTPPAFLMATAEDGLTVYGALPIAQRYSRLGLPYELHVFQHGRHGYSLASEAAADGNAQKLDAAFAQWHPLSVLWLKRLFGEPAFGEKQEQNMLAALEKLGFHGERPPAGKK